MRVHIFRGQVRASSRGFQESCRTIHFPLVRRGPSPRLHSHDITENVFQALGRDANFVATSFEGRIWQQFRLQFSIRLRPSCTPVRCLSCPCSPLQVIAKNEFQALGCVATPAAITLKGRRGQGEGQSQAVRKVMHSPPVYWFTLPLRALGSGNDIHLVSTGFWSPKHFW